MNQLISRITTLQGIRQLPNKRAPDQKRIKNAHMALKYSAEGFFFFNLRDP